MEISESNLMVKKSLKSCILYEKNSNITTLEEFGAYKYCIDLIHEKNIAVFNFYCQNFEDIYDFTIKEWLEKEFPGN